MLNKKAFKISRVQTLLQVTEKTTRSAMFAKHSPPARRKQAALGTDRSKSRKKSDFLSVGEGERGSQATEVRNLSQLQPLMDNETVSPNISHQAVGTGAADQESQSGSLSKGEGEIERSQNPGNDIQLKDACSELVKGNVKPDEKRAGGSAVGKLSATMYKPFGTRSRSASLSGSEVAICKGGPNGSCGNEVVDADEAMQCDHCDKWYHCSCQEVPSATYRVAAKHKALMWLCKDCKEIIRASRGYNSVHEDIASLSTLIGKLMHSNMEQLQTVKGMLRDQHHELVQQLQDQEQAISSTSKKNEDEKLALEKVAKALEKSIDASNAEQLELAASVKEEQRQLMKVIDEQGQLLWSSLKDNETRQKSYASMVKGQCKEVVNTISTQIEKLPSEQINQKNKGTGNAPMQFTGIFDAFVDRERRKNNVVVHNLTESDGDTHTERMTKDRSKLGELLRRELNLNVRIVKTFRVGKYAPGKNRLLIATMDSEETKWEVVRIAPQLRGTDTGSNIFINPDLTKQEREQGKKLRGELAERRAKGERNLAIRRGRIIKLKQAPDGPDFEEHQEGRTEGEQVPQKEDPGNRSDRSDGYSSMNVAMPQTSASDAPTLTSQVNAVSGNAHDAADDGHLASSSSQSMQDRTDDGDASIGKHHGDDLAGQHKNQTN